MSAAQQTTNTARTLVVATHNKGKVSEIQELLRGANISIVSAAELNLPEPEETGDSFNANAELKARAAALATKQWALSDDSGLCVEALGGAPGIYSARWAEGKNFAPAFARIERELAGKKATPPYSAYFICVLCLCSPEGETICFEGRVHGTLSFPPRGDKGFGYDPIFTMNGHSRTFAEIDHTQKNRLSHRYAAFEKLSVHLQQWK